MTWDRASNAIQKDGARGLETAERSMKEQVNPNEGSLTQDGTQEGGKGKRGGQVLADEEFEGVFGTGTG